MPDHMQPGGRRLGRRVRGWRGRALATMTAVLLGGLSSIAAAEGSKVTIVGGADESAHNYAWTVTNRHVSPIVSIEFPHYRADTFTAPPNWTKKVTFLVNVGVPDEPGVCTATAAPDEGIAPGQSAEFGMRITGAGAAVGSGDVKVRFADGTQDTITGVTLPQPNPVNLKYMPLIGLAVIFVIVVVIRERRRGRPSAGDGADEAAPPEEP